jgi:hypothetical protein
MVLGICGGGVTEISASAPMLPEVSPLAGA